MKWQPCGIPFQTSASCRGRSTSDCPSRRRPPGRGAARQFVVPHQSARKPCGTEDLEASCHWGHGITTDDAGRAPLLQNPLEQAVQSRIILAVNALGTAQKLEQPAGQVAVALRGVPAAPIGPFQVDHDEIHPIQWIRGRPRAGKTDAMAQLRRRQQGFRQGRGFLEHQLRRERSDACRRRPRRSTMVRRRGGRPAPSMQPRQPPRSSTPISARMNADPRGFSCCRPFGCSSNRSRGGPSPFPRLLLDLLHRVRVIPLPQHFRLDDLVRLGLIGLVGVATLDLPQTSNPLTIRPNTVYLPSNVLFGQHHVKLRAGLSGSAVRAIARLPRKCRRCSGLVNSAAML